MVSCTKSDWLAYYAVGLQSQRKSINMRKNFTTLRVTEHWNRLPREVVESSSLEVFRTCLDKVLCSLL